MKKTATITVVLILAVLAARVASAPRAALPVSVPIPLISDPGSIHDAPAIAAEHVTLFDAANRSNGTGTYNHHAVIASIGGRIYTAWSNHRDVEDGPGMRPLVRVLNGVAWAPVVDVFGRVGETRGEYEPGDIVQPLAFVASDDNVFLVSTYCRMVSRTDRPKPIRVGMGRFAVQVDVTGQPIGSPFWLAAESLAYNNTALQVGEPRRESSIIARYLASPVNAPAWEFADWTTRIEAADATRLCEPTTYRAAHGFARLWRSLGDPIIYAQHSSDGREWTPAAPTNIPDSPSKTCSVNLPGGGVAIIGNFAGNTREGDRGPLIVAVSRDCVAFSPVGVLRRDEQGPKFRTHNDRKCAGAQYPAAVIHEGSLWVIYSVAKENIEVARVALEEVR